MKMLHIGIKNQNPLFNIYVHHESKAGLTLLLATTYNQIQTFIKPNPNQNLTTWPEVLEAEASSNL